MLLFECPKLPGGIGLLRVHKFQISLPHNPITLHLVWLCKRESQTCSWWSKGALSFQCHWQHLPAPGKGTAGNISTPNMWDMFAIAREHGVSSVKQDLSLQKQTLPIKSQRKVATLQSAIQTASAHFHSQPISCLAFKANQKSITALKVINQEYYFEIQAK